MDSARRLYVYTLSGISLLLLTIAGVNIVGVLFDAVRWRVSSESLLAGEADGLRQQVSVYASIALVSLPVWGLHWWLAQRAVGGNSAEVAGDDEHSSTLRALYRAVVLIGSTIAVVVAAVDLLQRALEQLLVSPRLSGGSDVPQSLAVLLVVGAVGLYHERTMARPAVVVPSGAAGWLGRVPTLLALSIGLGMVLSGTARLIGVMVERVFWSGDVLHSQQAWAHASADASAVALIGLTLWTPLWIARTRLQRADASDRRDAAERHANLWQLWLILATVVTLTIAAIMLQLALYRSLDWLFLDASIDERGVGLDAVSLVLRSLPALAIGGYLLWWTRAAARARTSDDDDVGLQRAQWFGVAVPGLAMLGSGLVMLGVAVVDTTRDVDVLDGDTDWPRRALLRAIAVVAVGLIVWAIGWTRGLRLPGSSTSRERRGYLLLVVGSALVVSLGASAVLLYTLLQRLLDATPSSGSSISTSLLTLAVALPILLIHGLLFRATPDASPRAATTALEPTGERASGTATATILRPDLGAARTRTVRLVLHLPSERDAADVVADLRRHLPDDARIEVESEDESDGATDRGVPPR